MRQFAARLWTGLEPSIPLYRAVSPMLHYFLEEDEPAGLAWFSQISLAYRQGNPNITSANPDIFGLVREFWPKLPPAAKREALTALIGKLNQPDVDIGPQTYRSRVKTSAGTLELSSRNEQLLLQVMPLVRELDPDWADRLAEDRPALFRQAGQPGVSIGEVQQVTVSGNSDQTATTVGFLQRQQQIGTVYAALGRGPGAALQVAGQLTDPSTHLRALEGVAGSLDDTKDTSSMATIGEQAKRVLESAKKPLDRYARSRCWPKRLRRLETQLRFTSIWTAVLTLAAASPACRGTPKRGQTHLSHVHTPENASVPFYPGW